MDDNLLIHKDFLRTLPEPLTAALEARAVVRRFSDGETIFRRGDDAHGLFGVKQGQVQVLGHGEDGRPFVLTVLAPGEWFGELSLFDGLPRTHDNVAIGDTELWFVDQRDFHAIVASDPAFARHFHELLARRVRMLFRRVEDAVLLDLPARLAKRLLELAGDHGDAPGRDGQVEIALHLPQEDLAAMIGATREAVGRHLKRFERQGWISLAYGRVTIRDRDGLSSLL